MAKKYKNEDLKSLKRDEIFDLLNKEDIKFDEKASLFALRGLLLNVEDGADAEVKETPVKETPVEETPVEETAEPVVEPVKEMAEPEPVVEPVKPVDSEVAHAAFQNELSKRMATFGRAKQSVFALELARRQGKVTGKISFAEELKIRQNKARR